MRPMAAHSDIPDRNSSRTPGQGMPLQIGSDDPRLHFCYRIHFLHHSDPAAAYRRICKFLVRHKRARS
jgi:hypothetical protein